MKYGENTQLVEDVVSLFNSVDFSPDAKIDKNKYVVVTDFDEATSLAWEKTYGDSELLWSDIKEEQMSMVWDAVYKIDGYNDYDSILQQEFDSMSKRLGKQLDRDYHEIIDEILADFQGCLYSRFAFGESNSFYESLFEVYKSKAWPCGWSGEYPIGKIVAYIPGEQSGL